MTTARDICTQALKKCGVVGLGQTPMATDINDAFTDLQDMMAQWRRQRWLVYALIDVSKVSTGATSYTVGPGGDFNTARPDRLEAAYFRQVVQSQPNQVDWQLAIIPSREVYSRITLKTLVTWPQYVWYDSAYPLGAVYPWPVIQSGIYELHLILKTVLQEFTNLSDVVNLPPEYNAALKWNLARRLRPSYQLPEDPELNKLADIGLNVVRGANVQISTLTMPSEVVRNGLYDLYSDQFY